MGVDFHTRGRRLDETIEVMRKLWSGQSVSHRGEFFDFENGLASPAPLKKVPVWSGGASPLEVAIATKAVKPEAFRAA